MKEDSTESLQRAVKHFFSGTMLSRITGMARDMSMAFLFGSHPAVAAFMMAFRFSNLFRRIFGEGALQSAFIPKFEEMRSSSSERATLFFRDLALTLTFVLFLLTITVEGILLSVLAFADLSLDNANILKLTALMFPGIIFICLYGLNISLLQCEHKFFISGVAPVFFNLIWIASLFILHRLPMDVAITWLSLTIVVAYFIQWGSTLPGVIRFVTKELKTKILSSVTLFSTDLKRLAKPLFLGVIGISATQVNSTLDPIFARSADLEGPAFLWYAIRIQQLPLALLGIAFAGALLPSLSRASKAGDEKKYNELLNYGLRRSLSLMIPITFAIFAMGASSVSLLFGRGDFTDRAVAETTRCLWGYGLGLVPMTTVLLFASAFFAQSKFGRSAKASFLSMLLNVILNAWFIFGFNLSSASVAYATSVAAFFNCFYMAYPLYQREGWKSGIVTCILKVSIAGFIAAVSSILFGYFVLNDPAISLFSDVLPHFPRNILTQFTNITLETLCFGLTLLIAAKLLNAQDLLSLIKIRKRSPEPISAPD